MSLKDYGTDMSKLGDVPANTSPAKVAEANFWWMLGLASLLAYSLLGKMFPIFVPYMESDDFLICWSFLV